MTTTDLPAEWPPRLTTAPAPAAVHEWFAYDRPPEYECVESHVRVPMRDGVELAGRLYRPGRARVPDAVAHAGVVSEFAPYPVEGYESRHRYLAERGYAVLVCTVRGSGDSGGRYTTWFPPEEPKDNHDLIEWLAAQPYCTGDVAQIGDSYASVTAYRVAALRPRHLRTIVPVVSPIDIYSEYVYPGGVPTRGGPWWAGSGPLVDAEAHADILAGMQQPLRTDFWAQISTLESLPDVEVPVLHVSGYHDIFKNGGFAALGARPDDTWLLNGPWTHYPTLVVPGEQIVPGIGPAEPMPLPYGPVLRWLDHWLDERPDADLPPARVVSYESTSAGGEGRWTAAEGWPCAGERQVFYPTAAGQLVRSTPAAGVTRYATHALDGPSVDLMGSVPWDPGQDQAVAETSDARPNGRYQTGRVVFTLPTFEEDVVVKGPVTLHLRAALTAADTYFVSKLETVLPDGRVLPIEAGYLRARLRRTLAEEEDIPAGVPVDYEIELGHTHWRFLAGECLRLSLSAGDAPMVLPTVPAGLVTVHHGGGTRLELPLVRSVPPDHSSPHR